jgi:hypothetical protein
VRVNVVVGEKRVNVLGKMGWILERFAKELEAIPGVRVNAGREERTYDNTAEINYFITARDAVKYPQAGRKIALFTHGERGFVSIGALEACVAMNETMAAKLRELGARDVTVIRAGTWPKKREPVFGVIGRVYRDGRKGEALVRAAVEHGFRFVSCGLRPGDRRWHRTMLEQWPCPMTHGIDEREAFYDSIDYLVVTATEEGGPMTVPEAIARHVPVIASPEVGHCGEFPIIPYERGSWESLRKVLEGLSQPPTWEGWVDAHRQLFARLLEPAVRKAS